MQRPRSITVFEGCYLGAWLLGVVNLALTWDSRIEQANVAVARSGMTGGGIVPFMIAGLLVGSLITLTLWFFVALRGAVVAKWIVVALFGLGVLGLLMSLVQGSFVPGLAGVLTVVSWVLQAVGVAMLFRPDATAWFAARSGIVR